MQVTGEQFTAVLFILMSAAAEGQVPDEEEDSVKQVIAGCMAIMRNEKLVKVAVEALNSRDK